MWSGTAERPKEAPVRCLRNTAFRRATIADGRMQSIKKGTRRCQPPKKKKCRWRVFYCISTWLHPRRPGVQLKQVPVIIFYDRIEWTDLKLPTQVKHIKKILKSCNLLFS